LAKRQSAEVEERRTIYAVSANASFFAMDPALRLNCLVFQLTDYGHEVRAW
jgi:hypothetical protein